MHSGAPAPFRSPKLPTSLHRFHLISTNQFSSLEGKALELKDHCSVIPQTDRYPKWLVLVFDVGSSPGGHFPPRTLTTSVTIHQELPRTISNSHPETSPSQKQLYKILPFNERCENGHDLTSTNTVTTTTATCFKFKSSHCTTSKLSLRRIQTSFVHQRRRAPRDSRRGAAAVGGDGGGAVISSGPVGTALAGWLALP